MIRKRMHRETDLQGTERTTSLADRTTSLADRAIRHRLQDLLQKGLVATEGMTDLLPAQIRITVQDRENLYRSVRDISLNLQGYTLAKETSCVGTVLPTGGRIITTITDTESGCFLQMF